MKPHLMVLLAIACATIWRQDADAQSADSAMDMLDFEAARNSFFGQADADADFALSSAELSDALGLTTSHIFDGRDYDGDGLISYSEYVQSGMEIFTAQDFDGDGILTMDEF